MALEDLESKIVFSEGSGGVFVEFLSGWKLWRERTGALAKIVNFWGLLVDFCSVWSGLKLIVIIF
jgi:hypothetical protein